jgi:hypothetical protein
MKRVLDTLKLHRGGDRTRAARGLTRTESHKAARGMVCAEQRVTQRTCPEFALAERVSFDSTPAAANPPAVTEPYGLLRHILDADLRLLTMSRICAGIGMTRLTEEGATASSSPRPTTSCGSPSTQLNQTWLILPTKCEHAQRRGTGIDQAEAELTSVSTGLCRTSA